MNADAKYCDADRIARFLRHELSQAEMSELQRHLDGCTTCSQRLESETVDANWWEMAGKLLADRPFDLDSLSGLSPPTETCPQNLVVQQVLDHLAPTDDPQMLGRTGTYEIAGVVGSGGMGVVLKAFDPALDRFVAIKTLNPTLAGSGSARQRFSREARAAAVVVHDNVIEIYGVAEANGLPYLVMPYVRGISLQKRLDDSGPLTHVEVLRIGMQTAAGLAAAHAQGLVHRDIKPANILLAEGIERVLITDFGLARAADDASLTRTGVIAGTPQYMSPEQARGEPVDQRSDLFSLGSVMYAMATGRPPFRAEGSYAVLRRITDNEPRPIRELNPDIPDWLEAVIAKLHAKNPAERFSSADELAELLEQCLAHVQHPTSAALPDGVKRLVPVASPSCAERTASRPAPSRRLIVWIVAACLLAVAALIVSQATGWYETGVAPSPAASEPRSRTRQSSVVAGSQGIHPPQSHDFGYGSGPPKSHDFGYGGARTKSDDVAIPPAGDVPISAWGDDIETEIRKTDLDLEGMEDRADRLWE